MVVADKERYIERARECIRNGTPIPGESPHHHASANVERAQKNRYWLAVSGLRWWLIVSL